MYQAAALDSLQDDTRFALRGRHGLGAQGDVFFGDERIFDIATASVSVLLPDGEWIMAAHTPTELDEALLPESDPESGDHTDAV